MEYSLSNYLFFAAQKRRLLEIKSRRCVRVSKYAHEKSILCFVSIYHRGFVSIYPFKKAMFEKKTNVRKNKLKKPNSR